MLPSAWAAATDLPTAPVEGQPLGANALRLVRALEFLGAPLEPDLRAGLAAAAEGRDAVRLQALLDPQVLLAVAINPEERVKVSRGPAPAVLQQSGATPFVVKVVNLSTATKPLRLRSPQAGPVYGGVAELSMRRQEQMERLAREKPTPGRFLGLEVFRGRPMTEHLSGLEVEYVLALISSSEAGRLEATIAADIGQGTEDLGFRGEVPVLFTVRPAVEVALEVRDERGRPSTARLEFEDARGRVYPPQAKRLAPDLFFQRQIYRHDGESVLLPPGEYTLTSSRGPEYRVRREPVTVKPGGTMLKVALERWVDPGAHGFFGGDHHIHGAGCAHYSEPTQGVRPEDLFRQVKGEGLNVGCVLTWGPCFDFQRRFFSPGVDALSEPETLLKYDLEISGFGSQALGHVCLLNLRDQTYPGSDGRKDVGWPTWTTPIMRWAKEQGGVTGYAHSASGLQIDPANATRRLIARWDRGGDGVLDAAEAAAALLPEPFAATDTDGDGRLGTVELTAAHARAADRLPNYAVPEMNGVGAMEICVSAAEGVCDFISAMDTPRVQEWNTWYHLLNCGFPVAVSGETDFPCMSGRRVGQGRVYVRLGRGAPLAFGAWCAGLAAGRSYVSDGFAHALEFAVEDVLPGTGEVALERPGTVAVRALVAFAPETPDTVAQGLVEPGGRRHLVGDTVLLHAPRTEAYAAGGERVVELVVNGEPRARASVPADGTPHELAFSVEVARSSWVALRQFPQLHTNPVVVRVAGEPVRASRRSARWCTEMTRLLWHNREKRIAPAEREAARAAFERTFATLERIAAECPEGS